MSQQCLICSGHRAKVVFTEFDLDVLQCQQCGHLYSSYEGEEHYDGYFGYGDSAAGDHFWWDEAHRVMYEAFGSRYLTRRSGRILDVGCGLGYFLKACQAWPDWQTHGCEISTRAVEYAQQQLGLERVRAGLVEEAGYPEASFDIITMWDVIEHLKRPDPLLTHLGRLLKPSGMLFMHTPNGPVQLIKARLKVLLRGCRPDGHYLEARDHLHLYSMKTMTTLLERCGFGPVTFTHLPPIQSVAGSKSSLLTGLKNCWYHLSRLIHWCSLGRCNVNNNLFVIGQVSR